MDRLRHARTLARLVLAWFAITLGVAVAAPVLDPQGLAWLCTANASGGNGSDAGALDQGSGSDVVHGGLHCPLCSSPAAPPSTPPGLRLPADRIDGLVPPVAELAPPAPDARPTPARGPPAA